MINKEYRLIFLFEENSVTVWFDLRQIEPNNLLWNNENERKIVWRDVKSVNPKSN